jgi:O-antigen ligase
MSAVERSSSDFPLAILAYLALLFTVPAKFVVPGFGAAGAPASLVGVGMFGLLVAGFFHYRSLSIPVSPIAVALVAYGTVVLAGYVNARSRPISALAGSTSDRAMITFVSLFGVAFFVIALIRGAAGVGRVLDIVLLMASFMCAVGLIQFFIGVDVTRFLKPPGLVANSPGIEAVAQRSIFNRPFGTALHPIEFGVVTAALVPIGIARAITTSSRYSWAVTLLLAFSALISISRSAVLALAVMFLVMLAGLGWRQRGNFVIGTLVFTVVAGSAVPGLIGTLQSMFAQADTDPSVQARIARTPEVLRLMSEYPWFGRGYGVFTPSEYLLLDNEIQKLAIEIGVIGVGALLLFILTIAWTAVRVGQMRPDLKLTAYALLASALSILISSYTFDAFFYHILSGVLYLNIGLIAVLWRCAVDEQADGRVTLQSAHQEHSAQSPERRGDDLEGPAEPSRPAGSPAPP